MTFCDRDQAGGWARAQYPTYVVRTYSTVQYSGAAKLISLLAWTRCAGIRSILQFCSGQFLHVGPTRTRTQGPRGNSLSTTSRMYVYVCMYVRV